MQPDQSGVFTRRKCHHTRNGVMAVCSVAPQNVLSSLNIVPNIELYLSIHILHNALVCMQETYDRSRNVTLLLSSLSMGRISFGTSGLEPYLPFPMIVFVWWLEKKKKFTDSQNRFASVNHHPCDTNHPCLQSVQGHLNSAGRARAAASHSKDILVSHPDADVNTHWWKQTASDRMHTPDSLPW